MLIVGAGGHAIEVLNELYKIDNSLDISFYDNQNLLKNKLFNQFRILHNPNEVRSYFEKDNRFILGIGDPSNRKILADHLISLGGKLESIISSHASIGSFGVTLATGLNIMTGVVITNQVMIGEGVLVHIHTSIHHDTMIGNYTTISPGCRILGHVQIGSYCFIGSNVTLLPGVIIGDHCIVGAGAVVTDNVPNGVKVAGVPAKEI